jgi:hypothetical protein
MTTKSNRIAAVAAGLLTVCALTGCTFFAEDELPTLQREATTQDQLPAMVAEDLRDRSDPAMDVDSVRLAGEHAGYSVYLAQSVDESENCLLIVKSGTEWGMSCGESQPLMTGTDPGVEARTTRDGVIPKDDGENTRDKGPWVVLTDDVIAREVTK